MKMATVTARATELSIMPTIHFRRSAFRLAMSAFVARCSWAPSSRERRSSLVVMDAVLCRVWGNDSTRGIYERKGQGRGLRGVGWVFRRDGFTPMAHAQAHLRHLRPASAGMTVVRAGVFSCGVWVCILFVWFWAGDGRSGTQFSGGGRPAWFSPVFLCHMADKRGGSSPEGVSATSFQFSSRPTRRGGWVFSRRRRWVNGNLRRERRGRCSKGRKARVFSARLLFEERAA